jgi:hypothetical protein
MTYSMVYGSNPLLAISTKQTYQIATGEKDAHNLYHPASYSIKIDLKQYSY